MFGGRWWKTWNGILVQGSNAIYQESGYNREDCWKASSGDALFQADGYLYAYFVADDSVKSKVYQDSGRVVISEIEVRNFLRGFRDFYRALELGDGVVNESANSTVEISDKSQKIPGPNSTDDNATAIMADFALDAIICDEVSI